MMDQSGPQEPCICFFFADGSAYWDDANGILMSQAYASAQAWKDARGGGKIVNHVIVRMSREEYLRIPTSIRAVLPGEA